jgi:hypothetical protein
MERALTIFHDSFPRSGNNFLDYLLKKSFDYNVEWGFHRVHLFKQNKIAITSIRHPLDSISSYIVFSNRFNDIEKSIKWYIRFISQTPKDVFVCDFNSLINQPEQVVKSFAKYHSLPSPKNIIKNSYKNTPSSIKIKNEVKKELLNNIFYQKSLEVYSNALLQKHI